MSGQVSRGSAGEYQADEQVRVTAVLRKWQLLHYTLPPLLFRSSRQGLQLLRFTVAMSVM